MGRTTVWVGIVVLMLVFVVVLYFSGPKRTSPSTSLITACVWEAGGPLESRECRDHCPTSSLYVYPEGYTGVSDENYNGKHVYICCPRGFNSCKINGQWVCQTGDCPKQ
jgi:hypothetical protein